MTQPCSPYHTPQMEGREQHVRGAEDYNFVGAVVSCNDVIANLIGASISNSSPLMTLWVDWGVHFCTVSHLTWTLLRLSIRKLQNAVYAYCFECNVYSRRPANPGCVCHAAAAAGRTATSTNHHCAARTLHMCSGFTRRAQRWARKWRLLAHASARNSASMMIRAEGLKLSHTSDLFLPQIFSFCVGQFSSFVYNLSCWAREGCHSHAVLLLVTTSFLYLRYYIISLIPVVHCWLCEEQTYYKY